MEALLQGTAKGQQRLQEAKHRTRDTAGERAAKRIMLQFADRQVIPRVPAVQVPAMPLQGVMLQVLAMSLQEVSLKMRLKTS